jgi:hypothetical protein
MAQLAADLLLDIQSLQRQVGGLQRVGSAGETASRVLTFAQQVAAMHNKLHLWAATGSGGVGVQQWLQELAEYQCCDYEDAMEATYLMVEKQRYKLKGETMRLGGRGGGQHHVTRANICQFCMLAIFNMTEQN